MKEWMNLIKILEGQECPNLEFKEAKNEFSYKKLKEYCCALANEGGGLFILGVNDKKMPTGTNAFINYNDLQNPIYNELNIRIAIDEYINNGIRVLVFNIPPRKRGSVIKTDAIAYMRNGSSLTKMDDDTYSQILKETEPDFSGQICKDFSLDDIDEAAIQKFKMLWSQKQTRPEYEFFSNEKILRSLGLLNDKGITNAAVLLFGKKEKIDRLFPGNEIILEWRINHSSINYDFRQSWREPFFKIVDEIWDKINARNSKVSIQEGLFQRDIYLFSEKPVREALLNAVTHRDYGKTSASISIFISPEFFKIESPGGFLPGITPENILNKREWRNRYIAETFEKAGLVERAGQGVDDIFNYTIREGKGLPDFSKSDKHCVVLNIPAKIKDKEFVSFLNRAAKDCNITLTFEDIFELENIKTNKTPNNKEIVKKLTDYGIIEKIPAKKNQYIICKKYYESIDKKGEYTRIKGLAREKYKALLLEHIENFGKGFLKDFIDAMPNLANHTISNLLQELSNEKKIKFVGSRKYGYWMKNI
jgi:ATP-dependent DNA helicase RecG